MNGMAIDTQVVNEVLRTDYARTLPSGGRNRSNSSREWNLLLDLSIAKFDLALVRKTQ
jgi:hypothetical protein